MAAFGSWSFYNDCLTNSLTNAHKLNTKAIVELADMLDTEGESAKESVHKATGLETQAALFDEKNAVFVISGDENNLGEIFEVNLGGVVGNGVVAIVLKTVDDYLHVPV